MLVAAQLVKRSYSSFRHAQADLAKIAKEIEISKKLAEKGFPNIVK